MISKGCRIRTQPGEDIYSELILAEWFVSEGDDVARDFLSLIKTTVHEALKAETMEEKVAQAITAGIDDTVAALDNKDYDKAYDSVVLSKSIALDEAMQQAVKCEVWEPLRKHLEMRKKLDKAFGD